MKEQLIEIIHAEGYDMITASEIASALIRELDPGINTYHIGTATIKIHKGA